MKTCRIIAMFLTLFFAPMAIATAITMPPYEYGRQIPADDPAGDAFRRGKWHIFPIDALALASDAGELGPGYALFDFSSLTTPTTSASLSFQIIHRTYDVSYDSDLPLYIYAISNITALTPPVDWQAFMSLEEYMESFFDVKADLTSGMVYAEFIAPVYSEGTIMDVMLTSEAVTAINAPLGGILAIGLGPGGSTDGFFSPSEAGGVTLGNLQMNPNAVSEPGTLLLLGMGLMATGRFFHRKLKRQ